MLYEPVTQTLCTGFCVSPGIVATAAHCLFQSKNNRLPDLGALNFRLDYGKISLSSGIAGARTGAAKHYVAAGTTTFSQEPPLSAPRDWALVKLDRPICRFGFLDVESQTAPELIAAARDGRVFQIAYHWDWRHWQLAYGGPCAISRDYNQIRWRFISQHFSNPQDLILHDCDTGGASSGSPLLIKTPKGVAVVGINVGTYTRTRILLRYGRVVKRLKPDVIANTGVMGAAFAHVIPKLDSSQIVERREDIKKMQTALHARGLFSAVTDGDYGRATRTAIRIFEQSNNMPVTGLPTMALYSRLMDEKVTPSHLNTSVSSGPPSHHPASRQGVRHQAPSLQHEHAAPAAPPVPPTPPAPQAPAIPQVPPARFEPTPPGDRGW
jgi:protease YdgD